MRGPLNGPIEEEGKTFRDKTELFPLPVCRRPHEHFQRQRKQALQRRVPRTYEPLSPFTASLSALPALNVGAVEAAISRLSPVLGLRPIRA